MTKPFCLGAGRRIQQGATSRKTIATVMQQLPDQEGRRFFLGLQNQPQYF
jgi:hypothetical protein